MASRLQSSVLNAAVALMTVAWSDPSRHEIAYDFDHDLALAPGPDTFRIYRGAKGDVSLSTEFKVSGNRSLMLRDARDDGKFPELQGYFPVRRSGRLYFKFSMLVANPNEELNVALAGPEWFRLEQDGIGFWLKTEDGALRHVTGGISKKLFAVEAFVWYAFDVAVDLTAGFYDLRIFREGEREPIADLKAQPLAAGAGKTALDKFSFVGSVFNDESSVVYYVDDLKLRADHAFPSEAFAAPGRRKLFVDRYVELQTAEVARPRCPSLASYAEVWLPDSPESGLEGKLLDSISEARAPESAAGPVRAFFEWKTGCAALAASTPRLDLAEMHFSRAITGADVPLYRLSRAVARSASGQTENAWVDVEAARSATPYDSRVSVVAGLVAFAKGETRYGTELWRAAVARLDSDGVDPALTQDLSKRLYFSLLYQSKFKEAAAFAHDRATIQGGEREWTIREGDAYFLERLLELSRAAYANAPPLDWDPVIYERLSDLAFLRGDVMEERRQREKVYGSIGGAEG